MAGNRRRGVKDFVVRGYGDALEIGEREITITNEGMLVVVVWLGVDTPGDAAVHWRRTPVREWGYRTKRKTKG